jgi:hypothetical protein
MNETNGHKLSVTSWVQIVTSLLTMLASLGLWLVRTATTPSLETTEIRAQITEINKEMVTLQLDNEKFRLQIQYLIDQANRERSK